MPTAYKSVPVFLSGFNVITGYTCPVDKIAIIKQISLSNETSLSGYVDIKWIDNNSVGVGTTLINNKGIYPLVISGIVSGFTVVKALQEFVVIQENDNITLRTPHTGRINSIFTILEQDVEV